jgi:RimJ/RimL family protein N-acetyltransferase
MLPPRRTPRLWLRELVAADVGPVHAFESDPKVARYMTYPPLSREESRRYVENCMADARAEPRRTWELAIVRAADNAVIGRTGFAVDEERCEAMLWYALHRDAWGQGYAGEAAASVLALLFDELAIHRVIADVDPRNTASARLCERLGLRREAHLVENAYIKGEWCDTWIFAMLRREWTARKAAARE